jgi:intracellular sulfur oxidation DsrE/DsrF family protein
MHSFSFSVFFSLVLLVAGLSLATGSPVVGHSAEASPAPDAVTEEDDPPGIVMLVRRPQHVRAAFQTVRDLEASDSLATTPVEIVVCGKAAGNLRRGTSLASRIEEQAPNRASVLACGMSLENRGIDPDRLISAVEVVPNGLAYALKREAAGYLSVDL